MEPLENENDYNDFMFLLSVQEDKVEEIKKEVEANYLAQLDDLKLDLQERPLPEKTLIEKLILIRNLVVMRLQTCSKYCHKEETKQALADYISQIQD